MTFPLINETTNVSKTISETIIDIPNYEENYWYELTLVERDSLFTSLKRIYIYWREIISKKIRIVFTITFVTVLKIITQLRCFLRGQSTTSLSTIIEPPLNPICQKNSTLVHLPSSDNSSMAHTLVEHQTPNINLHQSLTIDEKNLSSPTTSLDNRLFFYQPNSERFLQFLEQFASETHLPKYQTTTNDFIKKNFSLPLVKSEDNHCDKNLEDTKSHPSDPIVPAVTLEEVDEDLCSQTDSNVNTDKSTRRRKRRSSLTKIPLNDQIESLITNSIEKVDTNTNDISSQVHEDTSLLPIENLSINDKGHEDKITNQEENIILSHPIRGRRLRCRASRETLPAPSENSLSPPSSSPLSSPLKTSPTRAGGLKRNNHPFGTTKKVVRFADTVGRELAQVQYIQSSTDDDVLCGKNDLYLPKTSPLEHKPWSFDVTLPSQQFYSKPIPRRFFCLYRQPNSEHSDIYFHEVWKSQIKLEHADVQLKSAETGEQYLHGTVWVTNAGYFKNVTLKYTFNHWGNSYEHECQHNYHSNDYRNIDQFQFNVDIPHDVDRIDFVLRYCVNGQEFWDNNNGQNYTIETDLASTPSTQISFPHDCDFNEVRFY